MLFTVNTANGVIDRSRLSAFCFLEIFVLHAKYTFLPTYFVLFLRCLCTGSNNKPPFCVEKNKNKLYLLKVETLYSM